MKRGLLALQCRHSPIGDMNAQNAICGLMAALTILNGNRSHSHTFIVPDKKNGKTA